MENPKGRRLFWTAVFVMALIAFGGLSFAQEEPQAEQPTEEGETYALPTTVGEITVTARKVEEDIQKVPVSVTNVQGEDLDVLTTGGVDVRALSGRVPSLVMESSFGRAFPRFYIRGLGNAEIARRLYLSEKTDRNHVSHVFLKLRVADRPQAIVRAREAGLGKG